MRKIAIVAATVLALTACKSTPPKAQESTPTSFAERADVLAAIESNRLDDADATLKTAPDLPDVHFLRARLAESRMDNETAWREIKQAVAKEPNFAEYQYEMGVIAGMPTGPGQTLTAQAARFAEGGRALDAALALHPDEPKYLYTRAYYLDIADVASGGDPAKAKKMYDHLLEVAPDSAWAHRVLFDRAAQAEKWDDAETEATRAGERDPILGSRLWLLVGATRLRDGKLDKARADLEAAAKLNVGTATSFCDAGWALDQGGNVNLAHDYWARCLELAPHGPRAAEAKTRLDAEKGAAGFGAPKK
ncbi:MAG TPA: hypothetical protein VMV18_11750 [bacterium]|nr:hypothetical protein [bacterium]